MERRRAVAPDYANARKPFRMIHCAHGLRSRHCYIVPGSHSLAVAGVTWPMLIHVETPAFDGLMAMRGSGEDYGDVIRRLAQRR
jgi:hypothetical protein